MDIGNLIRMANSIGDFFSAMPDRHEALENAATHLQKSWEPRMRMALLIFLDDYKNGQSDTHQLHPFMVEAVVIHRERLIPTNVGQNR